MNLQTIITKTKDILIWCGENAIFPILVSIVANNVLNKDIKKSQLPKLNIYAPESGNIPNENDCKENYTQIEGYYKLQREFDKKLDDFLIQNNEHINFGTQHIMKSIYQTYKNRTFNDISNFHPTKEVNYVVNKFKDNKRFLQILRKYEKYYKYSKWILQIENVGDSNAYDMKIDMFEESNSGAHIYNGTLNCNEKRKIMIYYFDNSLDVESDYDGMWENNIRTNFTIIDKKKFKENKYERLFFIKYKDKFGKLHEEYCCAYVGERVD